MKARGAQTGWLTQWRLAILLAAACCAIVLPAAAQIGTGSETGAQNQSPTSQTATPEQTSRVTRTETASPGKRTPLNEAGLTFLPELRPTDGVPTLPPEATRPPARPGQLTLDRAVAVINGEVILASDVREQQQFAVFEPLSVPKGEFTPMQAMQQLVNRTLILQQMAEQQLVPPPSDEAVDKQIDELRKHLPGCVEQHCETDEGWRRFLAAHGYSVGEFHRRWKERMEILNFIEVRFRTGIRIAKPEIERYYHEVFVPQFEARKGQPPPLAAVAPRIDEVLLQQHVNVLLNDYLRSLKDAGNVQILDPAYNELGNPSPPQPATASSGRVPLITGGEQ
jgi:peptidyl-prolyl cis-trans isomerase SurA